jgi:hypothetical protein
MRIKDNTQNFIEKNSAMLDRMLERMAKDVLNLTKVKIPYKSGNLQGLITQKRLNLLHHQVRIDESYAAYQERGRRYDGSRIVKKYTTPGTGKDFMKKAGQSVARQFVQYMKQAAGAIRL